MSLTTLFPSLDDVRRYLSEDLGDGDLTAQLIPATTRARAVIVTREAMVLCGRAGAETLFRTLDPQCTLMWQAEDGAMLPADKPLCEITGQARALLSAERTALNWLQTLSATATIARRYAEAVAGTNCRILDTRKTLPGLRAAQKYAVACGGCCNHRMGLYDAVLIKENHIAALGSIGAAVAAARRTTTAPIEVEVENFDELQQALAAGPDRILLDNFSIADLRRAVTITAGRIPLEASGNIDLDQVREVALTGVDFISIGALTKNVRAIDLSLRLTLLP